MKEQAGGAPAAAAFTCHGATSAGKVRGNNEDAYLLDPALGLCVVADGMGGLDRGEVASQTAVDTVRDAVDSGLELADALRLAHRRIRALSQHAEGERMGATAVAVRIAGGQATLAWVGDSRGYHWTGSRLTQLTKDHSLVQALVDRGVVAAQDAAVHPDRSVVTRALGVREIDDVQVDRVAVALQAGDRLLLCTDGLCGYLGEPAMSEALGAGGDDREVVGRLIERTLAQTEAADNLTVVLITVNA
jgi:serine/threonine protein phosphatase PrpC